MITLSIGYHAAIDRQLRSWKLLPEPERLTELYFTQPNNLPSSYTPGQPQTVSFTVHDLEYRTTTYHYQIIEQNQDTDASQTLNQGSFTLAQNAYRQQAVNIVTTDMGSHAKVEVQLTNVNDVNESIDYLLSRIGV